MFPGREPRALQRVAQGLRGRAEEDFVERGAGRQAAGDGEDFAVVKLFHGQLPDFSRRAGGATGWEPMLGRRRWRSPRKSRKGGPPFRRRGGPYRMGAGSCAAKNRRADFTKSAMWRSPFEAALPPWCTILTWGQYATVDTFESRSVKSKSSK